MYTAPVFGSHVVITNNTPTATGVIGHVLYREHRADWRAVRFQRAQDRRRPHNPALHGRATSPYVITGDTRAPVNAKATERAVKAWLTWWDDKAPVIATPPTLAPVPVESVIKLADVISLPKVKAPLPIPRLKDVAPCIDRKGAWCIVTRGDLGTFTSRERARACVRSFTATTVTAKAA